MRSARGVPSFQSAHILDDDTAVRLGAGGVGGDVVHVLQGGVDHMALVGVHRLQGGAAAVLQNLLGLLPGVAAQGILALLPVALGIHIDAASASSMELSTVS